MPNLINIDNWKDIPQEEHYLNFISFYYSKKTVRGKQHVIGLPPIHHHKTSCKEYLKPLKSSKPKGGRTF